MAMMVVLETLGPDERAVFVLREVFGFDYDEIASAVGKSVAAVRQIAHRARAHVQSRRKRFEPVDPQQSAQITEQFLAAAASGDVEALIVDAGTGRRLDGRQRRQGERGAPAGGRARRRWPPCSSGSCGWADAFPDVRIETAICNSAPAVVVYSGERLEGISVEVSDGKITNFYAIRNPDKLAASPSRARSAADARGRPAGQRLSSSLTAIPTFVACAGKRCCRYEAGTKVVAQKSGVATVRLAPCGSSGSDHLGDAPAVLRALAAHGQPAALIGDWFGSRAVIAPSVTAAPVGVDEVFAVPPGACDTGVVGGGWFGYLSYPDAGADGLGPRIPEAAGGWSDCVLRQDADGQWWYESLSGARLPAWIADALRSPVAPRYGDVEWGAADRDAHRRGVLECLEAIAAGEIYQACVCTQFVGRLDGTPVDFFVDAVARTLPGTSGLRGRRLGRGGVALARAVPAAPR